ncbi:reverse transcriptase domain-containing protein, partial [Tanacetum coccineum]
AEEAFKQMKQLIAELPMLVAPMEKDELIVYLAVAKETVSVVLMTEREAKQMPVYFVSRALRGLKINYASMEKLSGSLGTCQPRVSVKGQIFADFIVERPEEESPDTLMEVEEELPEPWILFMDGSSDTDGSGAGLILTNPEGIEFTYALRFRFDATNNEAEYEALIAGLRIAEQMGVKNLQANVDSRLVANQVNGTQIPRSENKKADTLSKIASTSFAYLSKQVLVEELKENSICEVEILSVVEEEGDTWMNPIFEYLTEETLPTDAKKARAARHKSQRFAPGRKSKSQSRRRNKSKVGCKEQELDGRALSPLEINLDRLEERREQAAIHEAKSNAKMEKYYNSKVRSTSFKSGDLVYRNNDASRAEDTWKLGSKWEGPYEVRKHLEGAHTS